MKKIFWVLLSIALLAVTPAMAQQPDATPRMNVNIEMPRGQTYPSISARNAMVTSCSYWATKAGMEILEKGGNVVDAAIAVSFALGVAEPSMSGLGAEGIMQVYLTTMQEPTVIDFKGVTGAAVKEKWKGEAFGPKSVLIPGVVAGCWDAYQKYGSKKIAWADLIAPAIRYATDGLPLDSRIAEDILAVLDPVMKDKVLSSVFIADGLPKETGDLYQMPLLAETLKAIALGGADTFYKGEIAAKIAADFQSAGGILTAKDFADYKTSERKPLKGEYRGITVYSTPLPTGGLPVIAALEILDNFNLSTYKFLSPEHTHLSGEALKLATGDILSYSDAVDAGAVTYEQLLSKDYQKARAAKIKMDSTLPNAACLGGLQEVKPPNPATGHTTNIVVADKYGNTVVWTQTLSYIFGSAWASPSTGIVFNNEMGNFISNPKSVAPNKKVLTLIAPTILFKDGRPYMSIGTPGSVTITSNIVNTICYVVDFGLPLQKAIEATRFLDIAIGKKSAFQAESTLPAATKAGLEAIGTSVRIDDTYYGAVTSVIFDYKNGWIIGGGDPRRSASVQGF